MEEAPVVRERQGSVRCKGNCRNSHSRHLPRRIENPRDGEAGL